MDAASKVLPLLSFHQRQVYGMASFPPRVHGSGVGLRSFFFLHSDFPDTSALFEMYGNEQHRRPRETYNAYSFARSIEPKPLSLASHEINRWDSSGWENTANIMCRFAKGIRDNEVNLKRGIGLRFLGFSAVRLASSNCSILPGKGQY